MILELSQCWKSNQSYWLYLRLLNIHFPDIIREFCITGYLDSQIIFKFQIQAYLGWIPRIYRIVIPWNLADFSYHEIQYHSLNPYTNFHHEINIFWKITLTNNLNVPFTSNVVSMGSMASSKWAWKSIFGWKMLTWSKSINLAVWHEYESNQQLNHSKLVAI